MNLAGKPPLGQKTKPCVSQVLRQSARMQPCTLRIPGVCNGRLDTTVLCHIRGFGNAGIGQKPHDFMACYACADCHSRLDRRDCTSAPSVDYADVLRAVFETQSRMFAAGLLRIGEATP